MSSAIDHERNAAGPQGSGLRCPECGATNKPDAQWCGQCLTKFAASAPPPPPPPPATTQENGDGLADVTPLHPGVSEQADDEFKPLTTKTQQVGAGSVTVAEDGISWTCARCDTSNELSANICRVCGAKFAQAIQAEEDLRPQRDANTVALVSLFMPGAGHAYLGMWGEAVARAVISMWVVAVAIFAAVQAAPQAKIMAVLFGLIATGLWMLAAHDSYREASNAPRMVLLKGKFFLYLVLGLLTLSIVMIFATVLGARS